MLCVLPLPSRAMGLLISFQGTGCMWFQGSVLNMQNVCATYHLEGQGGSQEMLRYSRGQVSSIEPTRPQNLVFRPDTDDALGDQTQTKWCQRWNSKPCTDRACALVSSTISLPWTRFGVGNAQESLKVVLRGS